MHPSETDSPDSELIRRIDALEMAFSRLLAVLYVNGEHRAVRKALGDVPLSDRESFALAQIRSKMGDRQV